MLAEIAAQKIARTHLGWGSTGDWYTHLAGTHRTDGSRTVRQSGPLIDELPATHAALREGAVSPEQAGVIVDAIGKLPHNAGLRARGEAVLLEAAGRLNATDLAKAARHLLEVIDPDRTDRDAEKALDRADRAAHLGRYLSITEDGAGGVRLRGRGTLEDAATLKAALLPLTAPAPSTATPEEPTPSARHQPPRPARPRRPALGRPDRHRRARPGHRPAPRLPRHPPPGLDHHQPRRPAAARLSPAPGSRSPSTHPTTPPPTPPPTPADAGGDRIDWATLGTWTGLTEDGLELSPATVRRLACDADLIPIALGTTGEVLDVGRLHRLVTPPLWRALVCRDRHCAFPGCTRPPVMCHAHHIVHWLHGGTTKLHNLVLLCGHHHRLIHHTPWQVRIGTDGHPEFLPPPKPGQPPDWIRHRPRRE